MADKLDDAEKFDFAAHRKSAAVQYAKIRPHYKQFAIAAKRILADTLSNEH